MSFNLPSLYSIAVFSKFALIWGRSECEIFSIYEMYISSTIHDFYLHVKFKCCVFILQKFVILCVRQ